MLALLASAPPALASEFSTTSMLLLLSPCHCPGPSHARIMAAPYEGASKLRRPSLAASHQQRSGSGRSHKEWSAGGPVDTSRTSHTSLSLLAHSVLTPTSSATFISGTSYGEDFAAVATRRQHRQYRHPLPHPQRTPSSSQPHYLLPRLRHPYQHIPRLRSCTRQRHSYQHPHAIHYCHRLPVPHFCTALSLTPSTTPPTTVAVAAPPSSSSPPAPLH